MKRYEPNRVACSRAAYEGIEGPHSEPPDQLTAHEVAVYLRGLFYAWPAFNELGTTCLHSHKRNESILITTRRGTRERFVVIIRKLHEEEDEDDIINPEN